jgi:hypothetical protein
MHLNNRVLVTGEAGFIGSHLCERLLIGGAEVVCADNWRPQECIPKRRNIGGTSIRLGFVLVMTKANAAPRRFFLTTGANMMSRIVRNERFESRCLGRASQAKDCACLLCQTWASPCLTSCLVTH